MTRIYKIGMAVIRNKKLLLCEPYAFKDLITLGGVKEGDESATENLLREVEEELGSKAILQTETLKYLGNFEDFAAGKTERIVEIEFYIGKLKGRLKASSEIKKLHWVGKDDDLSQLSAVVKNKIFPFLINEGYL